MMRHIVLFKLKEFNSNADKKLASEKVLRQLETLPIKIDLIRKFEAATDVRKLEWSYDIVLVMDFDNMTDLNAYTTHPAHQEFVAFNKDYSVAKVCIDYEI
jgi:pyruvate/oxaloacetate carboxyltransferase